MRRTIPQAFTYFKDTWLRPVSLTACAKNERVMRLARTLVAFYYAVIPFLAFKFMTSGLDGRENFDPLWPLWWTGHFSYDASETIFALKLVFIVVSLCGAFFYKHFWVRLLVFVAIAQVHALESSFGFINHQWYTWLYTSLIMVFLPNVWGNDSVLVRRKFLLQIWFAQAMVMLTYFMAGVHKFYAVFLQWSAGEIHGLHPLAFAYQSADWVRQLQSPAPLAEHIITYPEVWWIPYVLLYVIQITAPWIMVRTSLQKFWVFTLLLFHFGTYLSMGITFSEHLLLMLVLFVHTPFAPSRITPRQFVIDLPVVGQMYEYVLRQRKRSKVY